MKTKASRRNFLSTLAKTTGLLSIPGSFQSQIFTELSNLNSSFQKDSNLIENEKYWKKIRTMFTVSEDIINLNNGGVCPQPKVVQEALIHYNELANKIPSLNLWKVIDKGREPLRKRLEELAGCESGELAINRNTTEALSNVIFGIDLKEGDEVILSHFDYPSVKNAWIQREKRDKIKLVWVKLLLPSEDTSYLAEQYSSAITAKTKIVQLTHLINWTGQVMPIKDIAQQVKLKGVDVIVDAAHSFGQIDFKISDWDIDYLGTSLHKWLCAPFGTGFLYVKKNKIKEVYPLYANPGHDWDKIQKFEHLGTRSLAIEQSINEAIDFHNQIGITLKRDRLYYLKEYWSKKISSFKGVTLHTPRSKEYSGALGAFSIEGIPNVDIIRTLYKDYKIHTTIINIEGISAVRVTPNIYTLKEELNKFVKAIKKISS